MRQAVVLGASGFVGAHVCQALGRFGWTVLAGTRADNAWRLRTVPCQVVAMDVESPGFEARLERLTPDLVVNCTGYGMYPGQDDPAAARRINAEGAERVARVADAVGARLIHVGTAMEYGDSPSPIAEEHPLRPKGLYAETKAEGGARAMETAERCAWVRVFVAYGPLQDRRRIVPEILEGALRNRPVLLGRGRAIRDYAFVGDIADGIARLAATDDWPRGLRLNLGSGRGTTIRQLAEAAANAAGGADLRWGARPERPDEPASMVADVARARNLLGWSATTTLADGLAECLRELRERLGLHPAGAPAAGGT